MSDFFAAVIPSRSVRLPAMRAAITVLLAIAVLSSTLDAREALAGEPAHEGAPGPLPLVPLAPRTSITAHGALRCECAPIAASDWHWTDRRIVGLKLLGFGVLSGAAGLGLFWSAHHDWMASQGQVAADAANQRVRDRELVSGAFLGVAGLSVLAGAALVLWPESHRVSVMIMPDGGALVACGGTI